MCSLTPTRPTTQRKPRPKPARGIKWLTKPLSGEKPYGAVQITVCREVACYSVREFDAPGGRGFEVEKIDLTVALEDRQTYHVYLAANGQDRQCECRGFLRWGHCRHADGLSAMVQGGRL